MQKKYNVAGFGEVLWDIYPESKSLGGAPSNFAIHSQKLGANSFLISCLGDDSLGKEAQTSLNDFGLNTSGIQVNKYFPTGRVVVNLDQMGNPSYKIDEESAWDHIIFDENMRNICQSLDIVCFGTLVQRNSNSKRALKKILDSTPLNCLKVLDVNFRQEFYNKEIIKLSLERADIVKMNKFEFYQIANVFCISQEWKKGALSLIHEFDLKLVIITLGENGSILATKNDYIVHIPENKVNVVSTVGAGDAYTASVVMGWLNKKPLNEIVIEATNLASHVCGFEGAIPSQG